MQTARRLAIAAVLLLAAQRPALAANGAAPAATPRTEDVLARAQELLDRGEAEAVLTLLAPLVRGERADPRALLLASSAKIQAGDEAGGRVDLEKALKLDPKLRQGWLNLAAIEIAGKHYEKAYADLVEAQKLDPAAHDSELNLGAVLLLEGKLEPASQHFQRYLALEASSADALYLVATNYANAGYSALALDALERSIAFDEHSRLRARLDANFNDLAKSSGFQRLLTTDGYRPPAGAYTARQVYPIRYDAADGKLLAAVLDGLRTSGEAFDPNVEVTADWALLWGEIRVKVLRDASGGAVELSAPPDRMTPAEWHRRTEKLLREILIHLPK